MPDSETTGVLIECTGKWIMVQDGGREHETPDHTASANQDTHAGTMQNNNQANQATTMESNTISKESENTQSEGFFGMKNFDSYSATLVQI